MSDIETIGARPSPAGAGQRGRSAAVAILALILFSAGGCASAPQDGETASCAAQQAACNARCDEDFERNPDSWAYQSCLNSCRPREGAICR